MKKLISIILTACICLSLLGGISFAGAADTATEVTFDFTKTNNTGYANADDKTSGTDWYWSCGSVSDSNVALQSYGIQIKTANVNEYVALTINVPAAGKYFPELYHYQNYSQSGKGAGGYGAVYLIPGKADETAIKTAIESGTNKELSGIQYFSTKGVATYDTAKSNVAVELLAGENTLIFAVESASDSETYVNNTRMWPTSLTLVSLPATTYSLVKPTDSNYSTAGNISEVTGYGFSDKDWMFVDADDTTLENVKVNNRALGLNTNYLRLWSYDDGDRSASGEQTFQNDDGARMALAIKKPSDEKYFYSVKLNIPSGDGDCSDYFKAYMKSYDENETDISAYTTNDALLYSVNSYTAGNEYEFDKLVYSNGSDDLALALHVGPKTKLRIDALTLTPVDVSSITLDVADSLEVGATTSATVMAGEKSVVDSFVTYEVVEESDVIDIAADGTVTAKAAGSATITATVGELSDTATITVTEPEVADAPTTISYGVFVNEKACASDVTANGVVLDSTTGCETGELTDGKPLTVTAKDELNDYTFRYWVLGNAATGRYYSSKPTVTVTPYANIALTAIYTPKEDEIIVDLFNWNGEYLQTLKASELGTSLAGVQPAMTGYSFANEWLLPDKTKLTSSSAIAENTQAVAQFTKSGNYDEPVSPTGTSSNGWIRNGKLVTYSEDYTFCTWLNDVGGIEANTEAVTDKIPLVVLENNENNYMLEYDEGEYEVVEAGILFGSTNSVDVDSAYSKAKVKRLEENDGHGQLTATSMGTVNESKARGYVIYKDKNDNDKLKVIYSK